MLKFEDIGKYVENILNTTTYSLYTQPEIVEAPDGSQIETEARHISNNYKYRVFYESGELLHPETELSGNTIGVNILNNGLIQDSSTPVIIYLQSVEVQFLTKEAFRGDLESILTAISTEYKNKLDNIDNNQIQISIDEFPSLSEREYAGEQYITGTMIIDFVIWESIVISNSIRLYLNEVKNENEIKYTTLGSKRTITPYADLRKKSETPFAAETSTFNMTITGLFENSNILKQLRTDHYLNNNFGNKYTIIIEDTSTNEEFKKEMLLVSSNFSVVFGQTISYELSFATYGDLN